ncbi:MAG: glycosyltransferase family 2 protein [Myxococcales bacterium]|nr:glycosyltransferase family 2 protein [Myxococcales bacterium]
MSGVRPDTQGRIDISIAMPALDEEQHIRDALRATLNAFDDCGVDGEVIVINDGSRDRTREIALEVAAADARVRLLDHDTPQGIGASFWDAVDAARGDAICMLPGDNENEPGEILRYWRLLDDVDVIVPFVYNREVRSPLRNVISAAYRAIVNLSFGLSFNYTNGTVLCRRSLLLALPTRDDGFFFTTDILVQLSRRGVLFAEVPYRLGTRDAGEAKALSWNGLMRVSQGYARLLYSVHVTGLAEAPLPLDSRTHLRRSPSVSKPAESNPPADLQSREAGSDRLLG